MFSTSLARRSFGNAQPRPVRCGIERSRCHEDHNGRNDRETHGPDRAILGGHIHGRVSQGLSSVGRIAEPIVRNADAKARNECLARRPPNPYCGPAPNSFESASSFKNSNEPTSR